MDYVHVALSFAFSIAEAFPTGGNSVLYLSKKMKVAFSGIESWHLEIEPARCRKLAYGG